MHFGVSWDIEAEGQRWTEINNAMKKGLSGYSWVRPLATFYIVKVNSQYDWNFIHKNLTGVAEKIYPRKVNFVMGPLMSGGGYNGWLPKELWPKIRERTK